MVIKTHCFDINSLRKEAYLTTVALNSSKAKASREHITNYMVGSIVNPTRGMIAYKENINTSPINSSLDYHRNMSFIMELNDIKKLFKMFTLRVNKLYPKTMEARKFLIESERVTFDNVSKGKHNPRRTIFKLFGI